MIAAIIVTLETMQPSQGGCAGGGGVGGGTSGNEDGLLIRDTSEVDTSEIESCSSETGAFIHKCLRISA